MAETAITPTQLVTGTASADIADADGTAADTQADGWAVALGANGDADKLLLKFLDDGSGATVTIAAGDKPPAERAGLGSVTFTLAASDVKYIVVEGARHLHDDNKIRCSSSDAGTKIKAFLMPKGVGGGSGIA